MKKNPLLRIADLHLAAGLLAAALAFSPGSASAATIHVDTQSACAAFPCTADDGQAGCSFGEAITAINTQSDVGACVNTGPDGYGVNDVIHLPEGGALTYRFADHFDSAGPTALPVITRSVTIHGHGSTLTRSPVSIGDNEFFINDMRFFEITSGLDQFVDNQFNLAFDGSEVLVFWDDTTFIGGNPGCGFQDIIERPAFDTTPKAVAFDGFCHFGGAGYISGTGTYVSFNRTRFQDNQVELHMPYNSPLGGALFADGGAFGMLNISQSVFTGNKAPAAGAIYAGIGVQMAINDSTFADNAAVVLNGDQPETQPTADGKIGGAIYAEGPSLTVNNSAFFRNSAGIAGALAVRGQSASVSNTTFFENTADFAGGAVAAVPVPYNYRDLYGPAIPSAYSGFSQFAADSLSRFGTSPDMKLQHVTAVNNSAGAGAETQPAVSMGGGVANLGAGAVSLKSLILTNNAVGSGGSGANCYGAFVSYGTNDANFPAADGACVLALAPGAPGDLAVDPVLTACNPDTAQAGAASCDPQTTSPLLTAALNCPSEDQHHAARSPDKCTVGAIEVKPIPTEETGTSCGNGQVEPGEECDNGEARNSNEPDAACRPDCTARACGDGIVDPLAGEECEPSIDPINCRSDCTVDLCFAVKGDAVKVGSGELTLADYLAKYGIDPRTGCSANPAVNQCQPLSSLGGPGSSHADFTVPSTVCQTTPGQGGCSLSPQAGADNFKGILVLMALPFFGLGGMALWELRRK